jgi:hypothetical protein
MSESNKRQRVQFSGQFAGLEKQEVAPALSLILLDVEPASSSAIVCDIPEGLFTMVEYRLITERTFYWTSKLGNDDKDSRNVKGLLFFGKDNTGEIRELRLFDRVKTISKLTGTKITVAHPDNLYFIFYRDNS